MADLKDGSAWSGKPASLRSWENAHLVVPVHLGPPRASYKREYPATGAAGGDPVAAGSHGPLCAPCVPVRGSGPMYIPDELRRCAPIALTAPTTVLDAPARPHAHRARPGQVCFFPGGACLRHRETAKAHGS